MKRTSLILLVAAVFLCLIGVSCNNNPSEPQGPELQVPAFADVGGSGFFGNPSGSRKLNSDEFYGGSGFWDDGKEISVVGMPSLTCFGSGSAQGEYEVKVFTETVKLKLTNDRGQQYVSGMGKDNDWWNTDCYVFEGSSESVYLKVEMAKDYKSCKYLQAVEFDNGRSYVTWSDNIKVSDDASCVQGLLTVAQVIRNQNTGHESDIDVMAFHYDWFSDGEKSAALRYSVTPPLVNANNVDGSPYKEEWVSENLLNLTLENINTIKTKASSAANPDYSGALFGCVLVVFDRNVQEWKDSNYRNVEAEGANTVAKLQELVARDVSDKWILRFSQN